MGMQVRLRLQPAAGTSSCGGAGYLLDRIAERAHSKEDRYWQPLFRMHSWLWVELSGTMRRFDTSLQFDDQGCPSGRIRGGTAGMFAG